MAWVPLSAELSGSMLSNNASLMAAWVVHQVEAHPHTPPTSTAKQPASSSKQQRPADTAPKPQLLSRSISQPQSVGSPQQPPLRSALGVGGTLILAAACRSEIRAVFEGHRTFTGPVHLVSSCPDVQTQQVSGRQRL